MPGDLFFVFWELFDSQETEHASTSSAVVSLGAFSTPQPPFLHSSNYYGAVKALVDRTRPGLVYALFCTIFVKCAPGI